MKLLMSTKEQFKMYLDPELVTRLGQLADKNGRRSAQQVAEEIIDTYWTVWSAFADAARRAAEFQIKKEVEASPQAFTETNAHTLQTGRKAMVKDHGEISAETKPKKRKTG